MNFTIAISKPNSSSRTDIVTTAVNTTDDSYIYMPSSDLKAGDGYRISFTSSDGGILAQSDEFSITDGTSTVSATASANSSTTSGSRTSVSLIDVSHTSKVRFVASWFDEHTADEITGCFRHSVLWCRTTRHCHYRSPDARWWSPSHARLS